MLVLRYRKGIGKEVSGNFCCTLPGTMAMLLIGLTMMILGLIVVIVTFVGKENGGWYWRSHFTYCDVDALGYLLVTFGLLWCIGTFFRWIMMAPIAKTRRCRIITREPSVPLRPFPPQEKAYILRIHEITNAGDIEKDSQGKV